MANINGVEQANFQVPFELSTNFGFETFPPNTMPPFLVALISVERDGNPAAGFIGETRRAEARRLHLRGRRDHRPSSTNQLVSQSDPLRAGEYAYLYVSGLGKVDNTPATGAAAPSDPLARTLATPDVSIGGVPCPVTFSGLAPGLAGVYQVNIRVADGIASGRREMIVTQQNQPSPAVTTWVE